MTNLIKQAVENISSKPIMCGLGLLVAIAGIAGAVYYFYFM